MCSNVSKMIIYNYNFLIMRNLRFLISSIIMLAFAANAETFRIPVGEFSELVVNDDIDVVYSANPDSLGLVVFNIPNEYAHFILTDCNKGRLKIEVSSDAVGIKMPTVYVYSSYISRVENNKNGKITVADVKPTAKFTAELQGNGSISLNGIEATTVDLRIITGKGSISASGSCSSLNIKNIGAGTILADELVAKGVRCNVTGTGSVSCHAVQTLSISGVGSGKLSYKGNPIITKGKLVKVKLIPIAETIDTEVPDDNSGNNDRTPVNF